MKDLQLQAPVLSIGPPLKQTLALSRLQSRDAVRGATASASTGMAACGPRESQNHQRAVPRERQLLATKDSSTSNSTTTGLVVSGLVV
jgi:hypothetical protein